MYWVLLSAHVVVARVKQHRSLHVREVRSRVYASHARSLDASGAHDDCGFASFWHSLSFRQRNSAGISEERWSFSDPATHFYRFHSEGIQAFSPDPPAM